MNSAQGRQFYGLLPAAALTLTLSEGEGTAAGRLTRLSPGPIDVGHRRQGQFERLRARTTVAARR